MRIIVHVSDLHFGRTDPGVMQMLARTILEVRPDLVAVSGDLTQRARTTQFLAARDFLRGLPFPQIVVPGNHDVPLYNVVERFLSPLGGYRRYINADLEPYLQDDEIAVVGLNSTRVGLWRGGGRVNEGQITRAAVRLQDAGARLKVVVTHHPFDLPAGHAERHLVGRAMMAMTALARAGADLFLAGHLHRAHVGDTAKRYRIAGHSALVVQAGTVSTRERGEPETFNVLRVSPTAVTVERRSWHAGRGRFEPSLAGAFVRGGGGWVPGDDVRDAGGAAEAHL